MYTKWLYGSSSHPEIITKFRVDDLVTSDSLFARKFEQETDMEIFNLVNAKCSQPGDISLPRMPEESGRLS